MNKPIFFILFIFFSTYSLSQEYKFDYYVEYDYKKSENDTTSYRKITLLNSKVKDFVLFINEFKPNLFSAEFIDYSSKKLIKFKTVVGKLELDKLNVEKLSSIYLDDCQKKKNFKYEIIYNDDFFQIIRKNKRGNKIIGQSFFYYTSDSIYPNQVFGFPPLINPINCEKFKINVKGHINYCYFIEDNRKISIYNLKEIDKINYSIKIN